MSLESCLLHSSWEESFRAKIELNFEPGRLTKRVNLSCVKHSGKALAEVIDGVGEAWKPPPWFSGGDEDGALRCKPKTIMGFDSRS